MFYRGQKVQVIKSNASRKAHPRKGDTGYLNNMFLFPREKFILTDIFFFLFNGKERKSEHKKFILDLGMDKATKHAIRKGANKLFFISKPHICLNPIMINTMRFTALVSKSKSKDAKFIPDAEMTIPQLIGTYGAWHDITAIPKNTKHAQKSILDGYSKIPIGQIRGVSKPGKRIDVSNYELYAWIRSMIPIMYSLGIGLGSYFMNTGNGQTSVRESISSVYESVVKWFYTKDQNDGIRLFSDKFSKYVPNSPARDTLIAGLAWFSALHFVALDKMQSNTIQFLDGLSTDKIQQLHGVISTKIKERCLYDFIDLELMSQSLFLGTSGNMHTIISYFYRSIFYHAKSRIYLNKIKNLLPLTWDIEKISHIIDIAKISANESSASLARVFEEIESDLMRKEIVQ